MESILIALSTIITFGVILAAWWFFNRKNRTKVSKTEEKQAWEERPKPNEIDDPLN